MEIQEQHSRFKDAPWFNNTELESVVIGGAGGIGTWLSFFLAKANFKIYLFDFDKVESHNLGGQLFKMDDLGKHKVDAIRDIVQEFCGTFINTSSLKINSTTLEARHKYTFSAFDNMQARIDLFKIWKSTLFSDDSIFIDGRLSMETLQIFCVTSQNMDLYESKYLFNDSESEDAPCTLKQTSHSAAMIATHMVGFFTNHITNRYQKEVIREVPFLYEYFIPMNLTEVIL